jgi:guanylate kinase
MASVAGKLVLIIGPSGVGKSVILQELKRRHPELVFPRSATTRERRVGEGDDLYRFLTNPEFDELLKKKGVLEWAQVHGGARYGTLKDEIIPAIESGKTVVREVDVQGFESISADPLFAGSNAPYHLVSVFILPESRVQLIERITKRAPISEDELQRRIRSMDQELSVAPRCTVQILNKEGMLEETIKEVESVLSR